MIDVRGELDQFLSGISRMLGRNLIFPRLITQVSAGRRLLLPLEKTSLSRMARMATQSASSIDLFWICAKVLAVKEWPV